MNRHKQVAWEEDGVENTRAGKMGVREDFDQQMYFNIHGRAAAASDPNAPTLATDCTDARSIYSANACHISRNIPASRTVRSAARSIADYASAQSSNLTIMELANP